MDLNQVKKLMERKKYDKKNDNGSCLIIGGSETYPGAAALAGLAALRAGCDTVTVASTNKVAWAINSLTPDLITKKVTANNFNIKNAKDMVKLAENYDVTCLGNGITKKADKFCQYFIKKSKKLKVVDADALTTTKFKDHVNSILTPNHKELEEMLINSEKGFILPKLLDKKPREVAKILQGNLRYFLQNNNVLVIKGSTDIIISKNKISYNKTGNPAMAKAGTGDVLAGLAAGFLAKTKDLFKSAEAATFINGLIADEINKKSKAYTLIASDIVEDLKNIKKL
jgi:ADP-dependent NAD(P)H-hydrate dehydratase / NAD(P)H-hydrate epimerase